MVFLRFHVLHLVRVTLYPYAAHCPSLSTAGSSAFLAATAHVKCLVTLRTNYDSSVSVFVVQFNGFM